MKNEINCVYYKKKETISLLYDYSKSYWSDETKKVHDEAKNNLKYIDIYINEQKIKFNTEYTSNERGEIRVKFIFHKLLTNTSFMFSGCYSLKSIDLSSFDTTNVNDMRFMFYQCFSLKSIDLSSFNTRNVAEMNYMFYGCQSLESIDISSFYIPKDFSYYNKIFSYCSSLKKKTLNKLYN